MRFWFCCLLKYQVCFLSRYRKVNQAENRPVAFLAEACANAHDGKVCAWVESDVVTGGTLDNVTCRYYSVLYRKPICHNFLLDRRPSGKGAQLIVLGAGSESGWVPNTTLIFRSKKNTGDYGVVCQQAAT